MDNDSSTLTTVTVVGGGNSAHILIPLLGKTGRHKVNLLTRRPNDWSEKVQSELQDVDGNVKETFEGKISKKSDDPALVIPEADVICLCMPVHTYRESLNRLAPFIDRNKEVFVGTIYGQAGFNWMVHEMERDHQLTNTVAFAIGLIPWICRTETYGSKGINYGGKQVNIAAVTPQDRFDRLNEVFLEDLCHGPLGVGPFVQACSFLSLTLSVDNQIVHPARCYGLWKACNGTWDSLEEVPYFYRDFDDASAVILQRLDEDLDRVRNAVRERFPERPFHYMLSYLELEHLTHKSVNSNIRKSFQESKQLGRIKTPVVPIDSGYMLDIYCRFFTDDIPFGLLIIKWIAEQLNVQVPMVDEIIGWVEHIRGENFLTKEHGVDLEACLESRFRTGIPPSYGISNVADILD